MGLFDDLEKKAATLKDENNVNQSATEESTTKQTGSVDVKKGAENKSSNSENKKEKSEVKDIDTGILNLKPKTRKIQKSVTIDSDINEFIEDLQEKNKADFSPVVNELLRFAIKKLKELA